MRLSEPGVRANIAANYVGRLWSIASVYLFVPLYVRILGIEAYGLIAFHSMALAILFIADAGLSSALAREAAKQTHHSVLIDLLTTIERILLALLGVAGLVMVFLADEIASEWLNTGGEIQTDVVRQCVILMGAGLVPQIMMSLYFGGMMGLQKQVRANAWTVLYGVVRSGLVIFPIYFWPDPRVFFSWYAAVGWLFLVLIRADLKCELESGKASSGVFSIEVLRPVLGYASGMLAMSVIAGINTQIDRLVVSKMLPLAEFSYYSIAALLAQVPTVLTIPIAMALLPRLTALQSSSQEEAARRVYATNSYFIAGIGAIAAFGLALFPHDVLAVWLQGKSVPPITGTVLQVLSLGGLFLALQLAPFQLSLAHGHSGTNVRLGAAALIATIPLQVVLTSQYGMLGAAVPWLVLNVFAFVYLGLRLNRRFNKGRVREWFCLLTFTPVLCGAVLLLFARGLADEMGLSGLAACGIAAAFAALAAALVAFIWACIRPEVFDE